MTDAISGVIRSVGLIYSGRPTDGFSGRRHGGGGGLLARVDRGLVGATVGGRPRGNGRAMSDVRRRRHVGIFIT